MVERETTLIATNATDESSLLYLLQVANGSFPSGAFSHSYGLETLVHEGRIKDANDLAAFANLWLRYNLATSEGGAVSLALRAAQSGNVATLAEVDRVLSALKLTRETREASIKVGRSFLRTISSTFGWRRVHEYQQGVRDGWAIGHYATAFGVASCDAGVSVRDALIAFFHATLYGVVGVATRIVPLGQMDAQRVLAGLWLDIIECAETAAALSLGELSSSTALTDIASMRHERLYSRLCMS